MSAGNGDCLGDYRELAGALLMSGMCVVPATAKKHPVVSADPEFDKWQRYQTVLPVVDELDEWFARKPYGLGFVCGLVSGGLEVLDLDAKHDPTKTLNARAEKAIREFAPGLWEKLVIETTPSGGLHLYFRCALPAKNLKLAYCLNDKGERRAVAETRGEGGFIMAAPSPGYVLIQGQLTAIPIITDDDRSALFAAARSLDTAPPPIAKEKPALNTRARTDFPSSGERPGDAYNASDKFMDELLRPIGWTTHNERQWTRPGKPLSDGNSANWDTMPELPRHFHVFTPNAHPLEDNETYTPFSLYAVLKCGGDLSRAARELGERGFGAPAKVRQRPSDLDPEVQAQLDAEAENEQRNGSHPGETPEEQMARITAAAHARTAAESLRGTPEVPTPTKEEKRAAAIKALRALCYARAFNFVIIPTQPVPRFIIKGNHVSTPGNIANLIGHSKSCKSTYQEAMIAAVIAADQGNAGDCDTLGVTATAPKGLQLIHLDTEQSIYDHDQLIRRAIRRAKADKCPAWLHSYCLTGFSIPDCRLLLRLLLEDMVPLGGTYAAMIDGIADLVVNVNDPEECNPFVAELHESAITFDCSIICNIHENPGQDFGKGRGHLGSQLERKAESNLRLKKTNDIVTVFSEKMRRGSILEKDGPTFSWNHTAAMHLSCLNPGDSKANSKRDKLQNLTDAVFTHTGKTGLRYSDFTKALSDIAHISADHASTRFTEIKKMGLITQDIIGCWTQIKSQG